MGKLHEVNLKMDIREIMCKSPNWSQLVGEGVQGGGAFVNTGSTRGETNFPALHFGED